MGIEYVNISASENNLAHKELKTVGNKNMYTWFLMMECM